MSLCNFRTFTVLLVLELAIETQVEAFTIRRAPETTHLPDLIQAENSVLAVRNDLRRNVIDRRQTYTTLPIETTAKTEEIQKNVITTTKATLKSAPTTTSIRTTPSTTIPSTTTSTTATLTTTTPPPTTTSSPTTTRVTTPTTTRTVTISMSTSIEPSTEEPAETPEPSTELTSEQTSEASSVSFSSSTTEGSSDSTSEYQVQASAKVNFIDQTLSSATLQNVTVPDTNKTDVNSTIAENSTTADNSTAADNSTTTDNSTTVDNSTIADKNITTVSADNSTAADNSTTSNNSTTVDSTTIGADKNVTIVTTPTASTSDAESASTSSSQNFSATEEWRTDVDNNTSYSTESVDMISSSDSTTDTSSSKDIDGSGQNGTTSTVGMPQPTTNSESANNVSEVSTVVEKEVESTEAEQTNRSTTDGLKADSSAITSTPYWKRYTMIDRKKLTTVADAVTSTESDDMVQAGTAQSSVSLEKALNISSDIPSLEELKNELLALNKMTTVSLDKLSSTMTDADESTSTSPEPFSSTEESSTISSETTSDMTTRLDVVSSKRAGFLDHSSRATLATEKATAASQRAVGTTEKLVTEKNIPKNKTTPLLGLKSSSMASQSQLAEDAINEELMKEEILSDTVEYTQRQRDVIDSSKTPPVQSAESNQDSSNEDKLSVKPISAERAKNGGLYTVSPNYKPLKKIEVQPPKPFVRNPDDNSWRIEGLNSLGIVVKANNNTSSKPFTQVLKNKTETEWNLLERYNKGEEPELRERLEKIAEKRKSKKKKINQYGETVYTDYSDSGEKMTSVSPGYFVDLMTAKDVDFTTTALPELDYNKQTTTPTVEMDDDLETTTLKTKKVIDEYESDDSDEPDYTLPNIDLKKYITPAKSRDTPPPAPATHAPPPTMRTFLPDRRPTIQYFPPREKQKVVVNDYDTDFQRKINAYTYKDVPIRVTQTTPVAATQPSYQFPRNKYEQSRANELARRPPDLGKSVYLTQPPPSPAEQSGFNLVDPEVNRASYVIKHLRDFIDEAVKTDDGAPATDEPVRGVTSNELAQHPRKPPPGDYYDYEAQFRKDVLDRFVENFNQNSERFKAEFPVVYNTSVVHSALAAEGGAASSTAFMKRLYEDAQAIQRAGRLPKRFDPLCDRTVELSPAYELHYYVPEEEEKEQVEPRGPTHPAPPPHAYRFRL